MRDMPCPPMWRLVPANLYRQKCLRHTCLSKGLTQHAAFASDNPDTDPVWQQQRKGDLPCVWLWKRRGTFRIKQTESGKMI